MENTNTSASLKSTQGSLSMSGTGLPSGGYYAFLILYLVLLSAFGSFVNDMYLPTLPEMVRSFHTSRSTVQLGLTFGMIGLGFGELILGPLSDRFGRKPILIGSLIVFAIGAICSVWSKTIHVFLWWRLVQGLGASGGYFLARTIPADLYKGRALAKVMALVGAINGFAPASAPVIGGLVARSVGWQGIFWILFGFSAILLILTPAFKESLPKSRRVTGHFGAAFRNYGILARNRHFVVHVMLKGTALGVLFAYISSAPFIIQDHYGFTQLQFGLFMGFNALFVACGATLALHFKPLKRAAVFGGRGLLLVAIAQFVCFYTVDNVWVYEALNLPMLVCLGMLFTVGNTLAMNEGRECAGDASALIGLMGYVFGATVSPLVGLGDMLHSTAITILVLSVLVLIFARMSRVLPADLTATPQSAGRTAAPELPKNSVASASTESREG
ncbi:MAG: multidrug effflux MFS transporter [Muribaculaceae bacterium]|nr:multidrug effflux MFS transporter [Muribaculaceae bacterium]